MKVQPSDAPRRPTPKPTQQPTRAPVIRVPKIPDTGNKDVDKVKKDVEDTGKKVLERTPLDGLL